VTYESFGLEFWGVEQKPTFYLAPPQFSTSVSSLNLLQNSTGLVYVTSEIPYYSQRLRWMLVSKPDWLDVSPTQKSASRKGGSHGTACVRHDPSEGVRLASSVT
jgi:hypothetical protein